MHIILDMARHVHSVSFVDAELNWLQSRALSEVTATAYRGEVDRMSTFFATRGLTRVASLTPEHWVSYIDCLSTDRTSIAEHLKPLKPSSVLQAIRITRAFLLHCASRKWIAWDPREVTLQKPEVTLAGAEARPDAPLPSCVRQVLSSAPFAADEQEARRHFAWALGFWGALSPRELASLRVRNLRISSASGKAALVCIGRPHRVSLPPNLVALWRQYREYREQTAPTSVSSASALISRLRDGGALSAWSIWALMQESAREAGKEIEAINPRALRQAYFERSTRKAIRDIRVVRDQAGKPNQARWDPSSTARTRTLVALHDEVLRQLRVKA